jgi:hypothetical protein
MPEMTPLGWFHTAMGIVALAGWKTCQVYFQAAPDSDIDQAMEQINLAPFHG